MLAQFDPKATHGFCGSAFQSIQHERPAHVGSIMHDPQLPFDFRICDKQTSLKRNAAIICSRGHKRVRLSGFNGISQHSRLMKN